MWGEFWERHRSKICAAVGAAVFLASGALVSFLPSSGERGENRASQPEQQGVHEAQGPARPAETQAAFMAVQPAEEAPASPQMTQPLAEEEWYLYITGCVRKPGVYRLPPNSRLFHLVEAAGGFNNFADRVAVNLAEPLADGLHIHVPHKGERRGDDEASVSLNAVVAKPSTPGTASVLRAQGTARQTERIDINRAPVETLTRLSGIGPALARRIVEYRQQHGPFRSVEDLIQVRGIGAVKLNRLREQAVVRP